MRGILPSLIKEEDLPLVSVVILNFNGKKYLGELLIDCIESVLNSDYPRVEVIIVDNGSTDGSVEYIKNRFKDNPKIRYKLLNKNYGVAKGNNEGIKTARGEIILLLNSDTIVPKETISTMVQTLLSNPSIGILGCRILNPDGTLQSEGGAFPTKKLWMLDLVYPPISSKVAMKDFRFKDGIKYVDWVMGAGWMIRKSVFDSIGLFDEDYWAYEGEIDLCYRARKAGYEVACCLKAPIFHYANMTARHFSKWQTDLRERNRLLFFIKNTSLITVLTIYCLNILHIIKCYLAFLIKKNSYSRQIAKSKLNAFSYVKRSVLPP